MESRHRFAIAAGFVLGAAALSVVAAPSLPDELVTNWDAAGEPDGTMPTAQAIWLLPALMGGILALFAIIPRIDPLRENIAEFRRYYDWFVVVSSIFLFLMHAGILAFNLGYEFPFLSLILAGTALLLYYTGIVLDHAKRNWFVGIRTPWTLSNTAVWDRTHALGATLFKLTAILTLGGVVVPEYGLYFLLVPLLGTVVITTAYSYYLYERIEE